MSSWWHVERLSTCHAVVMPPEATSADSVQEVRGDIAAGVDHAADTSPGPPPAHLGTHEPDSETRRSRLWEAAEARHIPLQTIIAAVAVVVVTYLAGRLVYKLREIILLFVVAGFVALLLDPAVVFLQRRVVARRGGAVALVTAVAVLAFAGLAFAFGYPLVNGITHLAKNLPNYFRQAEHGTGPLGHLLRKYHIENWVQKNLAPKLTHFAQNLSKPALTLGKGAVSLLIALFAIFMLVLLLLLEGPKMRRGVLLMMRPERRSTVVRISEEVSRSVTGYMLGNFITSVVAGAVVYVVLLSMGVPFALLWALWVALVDFLPMIGGALAGIPTVIFAFVHSVPAGIVTLVVFLVYTQVENHILNPIVMSRTVRINPLLVLVAILVGANVGNLVGGFFGGFVGTLLAIPLAGSIQVIVRELWTSTAPDEESALGESRAAVS
jgi:predicted PurR-regulated permease PerM